jgi:hypothetical protein
MPDVAQFGAVRVSGLGDAARALKRAGIDATDLRDVVYDVGMIVVNAADIPVLSGALKASLRAGRGKQKAVVRAGSASVPYAAATEYGFSARNIPASLAINQARDEHIGEIVDRFESGIEDVLRRAGLL